MELLITLLPAPLRYFMCLCITLNLEQCTSRPNPLKNGTFSPHGQLTLQLVKQLGQPTSLR